MTDFMNALAGGVQARLGREQIDQIERRKALAPDAAAAIGGDSTALGRVAAVDPDYALKIGPILDRLDANKQAVLKRAADFTTSMGMGVLNSPPEHQPAAFEAAKAEAIRMKIPTENWPQQWDPRAEGWLRFNVNKAIPVVEHYKQQELNKREGIYPMNQGGASPTMATGGGGPANAIGGIESGGQPNGGYGAVGPVANAQGNRAYGKYQVLDSNIGPWTQEILGKAMSPQEFLATPQAQDAVFQAKFGEYTKKYGPEGASRAWFAGEGGMNSPNAADVNGMTVQKYGQKFVANGGAGPQPTAPAGPQVAQAPPQGFAPTNTPAQSVPGAVVNMAPPQGDSVPGDASGNPLPPGQPQPKRPLTPMDAVTDDLDLLRQGGYVKAGHKNQHMKGPTGGYLYMNPRTGDTIEYKPKDSGDGLFPGKSPEAAALNFLISNGTLSQQQAAEVAAGKVITNPADGSMIFMTPTGLVHQPAGAGSPAAPQAPGSPSAAAPPVNTPAGATQLTGGKPEKMTDSQANAALYADRMAKSGPIISKFEKAALKPGNRLIENIPFANYVQPEEYQLFEQARRDFINAVLRRESGAVISDQEFANAEKQYFPAPGNPDSVLKQKAENRKTAIEGITRAAGPAYKPPQQAAPADQGRALFEARDAIAKGAPADAVKARLKQMGVDPSQLDAH